MGNASVKETGNAEVSEEAKAKLAHQQAIKAKLRSVVDFLRTTKFGTDLTLTEAVQLGFIDEVKDILRSPLVDVDEYDEDGDTPTMHAAALPRDLDDGIKSADILRLLLEKKSNPNWKNTVGNTALHFACEDDNMDSILLLMQYGADAEAKNDQGKTPSDLCITQGMRDLLADYEPVEEEDDVAVVAEEEEDGG